MADLVVFAWLFLVGYTAREVMAMRRASRAEPPDEPTWEDFWKDCR